MTVSDWAECTAGTRVRLVTIDGMAHVWPSGYPYDATTEILAFFGITS